MSSPFTDEKGDPYYFHFIKADGQEMVLWRTTDDAVNVKVYDDDLDDVGTDDEVWKGEAAYNHLLALVEEAARTEERKRGGTS